ncbi:MAG: neutral/alkaline non-lysosomal ceramidase N-terminal domain-containing protein [bacterium]
MKNILIALSFVVGILTSSSEAGVFRAAAERTDITPPLNHEMWGYSARTGKSTGILDPLFAKILVLDDESTRVALVTLDLGRPFCETVLEHIRQQVQTSAGIDAVFFTASHTHGGPSVAEDSHLDQLPEWEAESMDKIIRCLKSASEHLVPARVGTGYGEVYIAHNRRYVQPDGTVKMLWRNATKIHTSPVDPTVGVIRIDDSSGNPLAILVNYSCHPVVLGPDNLQYTADFPGAMARFVEKQFDHAPICFFLQGAPGDINPYYDKTPLQEDGERIMKETGETLGGEAARVSRSIVTQVPSTPSIKYSLDFIDFRLRWDRDKVLAVMESELDPQRAERYKNYLRDPIPCPVMTLLINDEIALMGVPGEAFVEFATDFRSRSPVESSFFVGYANGFRAYFPTIKAAVEGGYGADSLTTFVEVGAGEAMVDHAIVTLYKMLDMLKPLPAM